MASDSLMPPDLVLHSSGCAAIRRARRSRHVVGSSLIPSPVTSLLIADGMAVQQSQLGDPQRRFPNLAGLRYELEDLDTEYIERIMTGRSPLEQNTSSESYAAAD